ncbi:MAG TPA: sugar ABC transporter permease [Spirillospora sp.]|nr:sugar ABC transporter permease [Spirillospora sp.]
MIHTRNPITPYLFIAPLVLLLLLIFGYPLVQIFDFSFRRIRGIEGPWVGLENYQLILNQPLFQEAVRHNLQLLIAVPIIILLSLVIAVVLYDRVPGWRIYRTIVFIPYILAVPIVAVVLKKFFQFDGPFNETLRLVGLETFALDWLGSPDIALWTIMSVIIWREVGFGIVLMLARLLSLDEEMLEAAELDGTNWWQRLWYVILPQMAGVIEFYFVVSFITMIAAVFSYVFMITKGGPGTSTMVLELYIFNFLTRNSLPGVASAVSVMLFLVTMALILLLFWLRRGERERELA